MPADDELIEAAPCPSCRSPLTVSAADLGHLVECPGCGTRFRARRPGPAALPPPPPRRDDRARDDDEFDDRPRRTARDRYSEPERDRDSGYDRDDDRYEDARRRPRPGAMTALAVMHFVYAGLLLLCGLLGTIGLALGDDFLRGLGAPEPNVGMEIAVVVSHFATAFVALFAGVLALQRRGYGLSVAAVALACVSFVLMLVNGVMNAQAEGPDGPEEEMGLVCGFTILGLFWLGYIVTSGILLAKSARHFR